MKRNVVFGVSAIALVAIFIVAALLYKNQRTEDLGSVANENVSALIRDHSPVLGGVGAKVQIVEFTDPACEACAAFSQFIKEWMTTHPGKIRLIVRYTPFHQGASDVVRILIAAKKIGKFWETLDVLYATQEQWTQHHQVVVGRVWPLLESAGLDVRAIRAGMDDPEIDRIIRQDLADAGALGVRKTPGLFVNGKPLEPFGVEEFRNLMESELRASYPEVR